MVSITDNVIFGAARWIVAAFAVCPLMCRFLDAGNERRSARATDRRPKSAKARSRGSWALTGQRALWGFVRGARLRKFEEWRPRMRAQLKRFGTIDAKQGI